MTTSAPIARGKPATFGQEILRRRRRLTLQRMSLTGMRVLDFGCGNGAQTLAFQDGPVCMVGLDICREDLDSLHDALGQQPARSIAPVLYDGRHLPLRSQSIDRVLSYEVLEHVEDESTALRELHRVMKPGAEGILTVPNKWWLFETHGTTLPLLPWHRIPFVSWLPRTLHRRIARARIYTRASLDRLLTAHRFAVRELCYVTAPMDALSVPWLQRILRRTVFAPDQTGIPMLATAILAHFRKPS